MLYKDKEKRRECKKRYYEKHKERIREQNRKYSKEHREQKRQWALRNKDKIKGYGKKYYEKNKEKIIEKIRKHCRHQHLTASIDGKSTRLLKLNKRKWTGYCELCKREIKRYLHYHHWNNKNFNIGLWLCIHCHRFAEVVDKEIKVSDYKRLKKMAEKEIKERDKK